MEREKTCVCGPKKFPEGFSAGDRRTGIRASRRIRGVLLVTGKLYGSHFLHFFSPSSAFHRQHHLHPPQGIFLQSFPPPGSVMCEAFYFFIVYFGGGCLTGLLAPKFSDILYGAPAHDKATPPSSQTPAKSPSTTICSPDKHVMWERGTRVEEGCTCREDGGGWNLSTSLGGIDTRQRVWGEETRTIRVVCLTDLSGGTSDTTFAFRLESTFLILYPE